MVVQHPAQAILLVQQADVRGDFFVRFIGQGDQWSFGGSYLAPLKYYPSRHGMMRVSEKPFMKVSEQGISGTGLASEIEEWFDLTLPDFEPVFSFPVQGHQYLVPSDIGRAITGFAMEDRRSPVETIIADLTVRFSFGGTDIGQMESTGIYERPPGERRFSLRKALIDGYGPTATPIGTSDFENLADLDRGPANERILTYTFSRLKEIASGNDAEAKEAIRAFLEECQDTPEKRELEEVLKMR
ncbi:MAG TPA: hypothetical protein VEF06_06390 [Bryobacteraceae bacterium]|nr:hypothetical protein [Bryobacteraceae bacterium]